MCVSGGLGSYEMIEITTGLTGAAKLAEIQGSDKHVTYEKKDASGNVLYSWTFHGSDITAPGDVNFNIAFPNAKGSKVAATTGVDDMFLLAFAHHGDLPGKAQVSVRVSDQYKDGSTLRLYYYDQGQQKAQQISSGLKVQNGYATFEITHCSQYFLTDRLVGGKNGGLPVPAIAAIIVVAVVLVAVVVFLFILPRRKGRTHQADSIIVPEKTIQTD